MLAGRVVDGMAQTPMASRTGFSSPFGKLDAELPKQAISGLTLAGLQRVASENDMTLAEFVRTVLDVRVHGVDAMKRMHGERIERVVGIGATKG